MRLSLGNLSLFESRVFALVVCFRFTLLVLLMCSYTKTAASNVAKLGANSFDRSKWQQKYDYEI